MIYVPFSQTDCTNIDVGTATYGCTCNSTTCNCPHHALNYSPNRIRVEVSVTKAEALELPRPRPRPWVQERAVVPAFKKLGLPSWRPRQQRARDGI